MMYTVSTSPPRTVPGPPLFATKRLLWSLDLCFATRRPFGSLDLWNPRPFPWIRPGPSAPRTVSSSAQAVRGSFPQAAEGGGAPPSAPCAGDGHYLFSSFQSLRQGHEAEILTSGALLFRVNRSCNTLLDAVAKKIVPSAARADFLYLDRNASILYFQIHLPLSGNSHHC